MSSAADCISRDALRALVEGTLPQEEVARVERHLEGCADCQQTLAELIDSDPAVARVASHLRATVADLPPFLQAAARRRSAAGGLSLDQATDDGLGDAHAVSLDFLAPSNQPGSLGRLGRYEISELVGRGGMGIVFRAHDAKLNRVVAVKALAPELAGHATARIRFLREAQAAAAITHQNVVTIHAVEEDRPPYLVMEFVDGQSLETKIERQGTLCVKEILRIGTQVAAGLAAAHAHGVIHRDIKPANILLENGVERVRITDFGLARVVDDVALTRTGEVAGTPQYMSPEQAQGQAVDARTDLFSLGCVLYAMCTGRSPFRADTTMAALRRVCDDTPRPICEINPEIPGWLTEIVDRLLAKKPDDRIQTAAETADLLGRHLAHVQAPPSMPVADRGRRLPAGSRRRWLLAAGLLLIAAGTLAVMEATRVTSVVPKLMRIARGGGTPETKSAPAANRRRAPPASAAAQTVADAGAADSIVLGAFVILARAGAPEQEFNTLAEVIRSSRAGDVIEIRGNGPFTTEPVTVDHALTLRAASGTRPVILLAGPQDDGELFLLRACAPVVLEGLVFQGKSGVNRARPWPLIQSLAKLSMANCRMLATDSRNGLWSAGSVELRNCEFLAGDVLAATAVSWGLNATGPCVIENCVLAGKIYIPIGGERRPGAAVMQLRDTTVMALRAIQFSLTAFPNASPAGREVRPVRVSTSGNLFACRSHVVFDQFSLQPPLNASAVESLLQDLFDWHDERNLYATGVGVLTLTMELQPLAPPWDLDRWNSFWGLSGTGTRQDSIRFQGGDLVARAAADARQLSPEDFRLHADSAGYGAGVDGRDLGPDIELVGPGEAYERWKQTPQYADWRAATQPE